MTSKDYLKQIAESKGVCPLTNEVKDNALLFPIGFEKIFQDLDKLEELQKENQELKFKNIALELWNDCYTKENAKLKKTIEILKNKKVNIFHIWALDDYKQYKQYYFFDENHTEKDMLTIEEFKFLKEVLEC